MYEELKAQSIVMSTSSHTSLKATAKVLTASGEQSVQTFKRLCMWRHILRFLAMYPPKSALHAFLLLNYKFLQQ